LYLGGGYPELYAPQLSQNRALRKEIRTFAAVQKPIYAECGGMMYLARELRTTDGQSYEMTGVLPFTAEMTDRLVHFGYADVQFIRSCLLGDNGTIARGHSFHYSRVFADPDIAAAYRVKYSLSGQSELEGYTQGQVLASYLHLHFRTNPTLARSFVNSIRKSKGLPAVLA
jgi:cobyrinic acid a,c-diamide synthase